MFIPGGYYMISKNTSRLPHHSWLPYISSSRSDTSAKNVRILLAQIFWHFHLLPSKVEKGFCGGKNEEDRTKVKLFLDFFICNVCFKSYGATLLIMGKVEIHTVEAYLGLLPSRRTQQLPPSTRTALYSPCI